MFNLEIVAVPPQILVQVLFYFAVIRRALIPSTPGAMFFLVAGGWPGSTEGGSRNTGFTGWAVVKFGERRSVGRPALIHSSTGGFRWSTPATRRPIRTRTMCHGPDTFNRTSLWGWGPLSAGCPIRHRTTPRSTTANRVVVPRVACGPGWRECSQSCSRAYSLESHCDQTLLRLAKTVVLSGHQSGK